MIIHKNNNLKGFTIIELLVVIVVIAILAAIVMISYPKVVERTNESVVLAELDRVAKILEIFKVEHGIYPSKKECPIADKSQICIEKSSNIDKLSYVPFEINKSFYIKADKGNISYIRGNTGKTFKSISAVNGQDDIVNIQPEKISEFKLITGTVEESDYFNKFYINSTPPEPTADLIAYIRLKGTPNYYNVISSMAEKYIIISYVTKPVDVINATGYFYTWSNLIFDNFGIDSFPLKTGWNKVVILSNEVLSNTQINFIDLPFFEGQFYFDKGDNSSANIESEVGKYVNTVPYIYKFE